MKSSIQLCKPPYPVRHDEEETAGKIETKNIDENKVVYQLTRKWVFVANASMPAHGMYLTYATATPSGPQHPVTAM